jgi:hypothetical protein
VEGQSYSLWSPWHADSGNVISFVTSLTYKELGDPSLLKEELKGRRKRREK